MGILLAVGAVVAFGVLLILRRQRRAVDGASAALTETPGELKPALGLQGFSGQIGSNVTEDVSDDLIKQLLDFSQRQIDRVLCWRRLYRDYDGRNAGSEVWIHTDGRRHNVPVGEPAPEPRCDGF
jgi:hypothetical protein